MNKYQATYYYGRDRDDWSVATFEADTLEDAERQARESTLRGHNYKSIKLIENQ